MVRRLKLTSKRQATLPIETCEELGVGPGDVIELERRVENGERRWLLRPLRSRSRAWVGCLSADVTPVGSHSMRAIRRSIAAARKKGTSS